MDPLNDTKTTANFGLDESYPQNFAWINGLGVLPTMTNNLANDQ